MISILLCISFIVAAVYGVSTTEYAALNDLFNQTGGQEWLKEETNWLTTSNPCLWGGISCLQDQLYSLDLFNRSLNGVVAEETLLVFTTLR